MLPLNNQIWLMSSAFPGRPMEEVIRHAQDVGAQGVELCVFRHGGTRSDHIATHLDYETFGPKEARRTLEQFAEAGLRFSIGAYENLIGGDEGAKVANQDHLLRNRTVHL